MQDDEAYPIWLLSYQHPDAVTMKIVTTHGLLNPVELQSARDQNGIMHTLIMHQTPVRRPVMDLATDIIRRTCSIHITNTTPVYRLKADAADFCISGKNAQTQTTVNSIVQAALDNESIEWKHPTSTRNSMLHRVSEHAQTQRLIRLMHSDIAALRTRIGTGIRTARAMDYASSGDINKRVRLVHQQLDVVEPLIHTLRQYTRD